MAFRARRLIWLATVRINFLDGAGQLFGVRGHRVDVAARLACDRGGCACLIHRAIDGRSRCGRIVTVVDPDDLAVFANAAEPVAKAMISACLLGADCGVAVKGKDLFSNRCFPGKRWP
jgi:hypothetical protein